MRRDPYGRSPLGGPLGLVLTILLAIMAVEAFLAVIAPLLPWIGLTVLIALAIAAFGVWSGQRDRW